MKKTITIISPLTDHYSTFDHNPQAIALAKKVYESLPLEDAAKQFYQDVENCTDDAEFVYLTLGYSSYSKYFKELEKGQEHFLLCVFPTPLGVFLDLYYSDEPFSEDEAVSYSIKSVKNRPVLDKYVSFLSDYEKIKDDLADSKF